jgi:enoyl-CoA hydratase/carnithine racemase
VPAPESPSVPVTVVVRDGVARVSLDRPPLNVLDIDMLRQLNDALRECDRTSVRIVVLASTLPRAFSAGVDVADHLPNRLDAMLTEVRENARLLLKLEPVTLAAVHGATLGGGSEIALLCDLMIAADDTVFGFPEVRLAAFPPVAAACLPELGLGPRAMRWLLGESFDAGAAYDAGLASQVVPRNELTGAADRLATELAAFSSVALRAITAATRRRRADAILQRLDTTIEIYRTTVAPSEDGQDGVRAFLEKRAPVWSHH